MTKLDLPRRYRDQIEALLHTHVPDAEVWAYGSRVSGENHEGSDLDLVLRSPDLKRIPNSQLSALTEALEASTIPILVQTHDWARLPKSYHREIEREYVVLVEKKERGANDDPVERDWLYHPQFPRHWKRKSLYAMAQWVNGLAFRKIQFSTTGKPVIKIAEIKGGISGQTKFTQQIFDESVRIRSGDLLFSWSGQPETSIDAFWWRGPEGWLNQHVFRVTPINGVDSIFFFYILRYLKPNFVAIARNKQTTGLGHVTKRDLENIEVALPDLSEQRAIAHILGTLDDKIELNRRMNETLEEMARALFKSWFVDFDPVRAKMEGCDPGLPPDVADLFPDRLVDSELGPIPEGWEVKALDEIANFRNGLALQKFRPTENGKRLPVVKIAQLRSGKADSGEWAKEDITTECIIDDGVIVFSWSGSLMVKIWCGGRAALNQHLFKVTSSEYPKWFYLHWIEFHLSEFQSIAADKATTMGHIKRQHLSEAKCAVPDLTRLAIANSTFTDLLSKRISNALESRTLAALRDALLPKLVSGTLRVTHLEFI